MARFAQQTQHQAQLDDLYIVALAKQYQQQAFRVDVAGEEGGFLATAGTPDPDLIIRQCSGRVQRLINR